MNTDLGLAMGYLKTIGKRSPGEKLMLLYFIKQTDESGNYWIQGSAFTFAKIMGFSARTFQRYSNALRERGVLDVDNDKSRSGMIAANLYSLPGWRAYREKHDDTKGRME